MLYRAVTGIPRHRRKFTLVLVFTLTSLYMMNKRRKEAIKKATKDTAAAVFDRFRRKEEASGS